MNTKDLQYFLKVYELKSISKAAQELFISPQGLSKVLIKLENKLEVDLFTRSHYGVEPTIYGDRLARKSKQIDQLLDSIKEDILTYDDNVVLNIASTYGVMAYLSIDFIKAFKKKYPNIHLNIVEQPDVPIEKLLINEEVDLAFLTGPIDTSNFEATLFTTHYHCLVVPKTHRLSNKRSIDYIDLNNEPLILMGEDFKDHHNNMNRFLKAGVSPNIVMETSEINVIHRLSRRNNAIGISIDFLAVDHPHPDTLIKPFTDDNCTWDTYITFKKGKEKSSAALSFYNFSLEWVEKNASQLFRWNQLL